jgi:hypothetical protein
MEKSEADRFSHNFWEFAIFGFSIAATVSTAMIPGIWSSPTHDIANFAYGAPACVESLLHATQIDVRDNEELLKPGFHDPIYASPKKYDAFLSDFGASIPLSRLECAGTFTDANGAQATAASGSDCLVTGGQNQFRYDLSGNTANTECADEDNTHVYGEPVEKWGNGAISIDNVDFLGTIAENCKDRYAKPFVNGLTAAERIVSFFPTSTAAPHSGRSTVTTTTTTRPSEERVIGPQQANVVLNVFYNQSVSPYLNGEKDENRCEEILGKLRGDVQNKGRDWNLFDDVGNLGEVMICNIVYGWALGEYCASGLDKGNEPYFGATTVFDSTDAKLQALDEALKTARGTDGDAARDQCENVTRTTCGATDNFIGTVDLTARDDDANDQGLSNAGAPPFMYDTSGDDAADATALTALVDRIKTNPCFMKTGYGNSPINGGRMFGSFLVADDGTTNGPVIPGTGQMPSVGTGFFKNHKGLDLDADYSPNHFVDLGKNDGTANQILHNSYDRQNDWQTISIAANPNGAFRRYNVRSSLMGKGQGDDTDYDDNHGDAVEFPRVQVPITQVDSRYIYERLMYDVLVLGQMADAVGREQDFYNMLPDECFSDGAGSSSRVTTRIVWTVFLVLLIAFTFPRIPFISASTQECGYTLAGWDWAGRGFFTEVVQTKIIFVLSLIVGVLGFSISMGANPDGPYAADGEKSGLQQWAAVFANSIGGSYNANDHGDEHGTYRFLVDLTNGDYHAAYGLDEHQQYMAYIASIMCAMITVLGIILILFKRVDGQAVLSQGKLIGNWA